MFMTGTLNIAKIPTILKSTFWSNDIPSIIPGDFFVDNDKLTLKPERQKYLKYGRLH